MSDMPLYTEDACCCKCGGPNVKSAWKPLCRAMIQTENRPIEMIPEHMERTCCCCGYQWDERPLDTKTDEDRVAAVDAMLGLHKALKTVKKGATILDRGKYKDSRGVWHELDPDGSVEDQIGLIEHNQEGFADPLKYAEDFER